MAEDRRAVQSRLYRGDLVGYKPRTTKHIAFVYSKKPVCNSGENDCEFDIIHANGSPDWSDPDGDSIDEYTRKVIIGRYTMTTTLRSAAGFGRITLWD